MAVGNVRSTSPVRVVFPAAVNHKKIRSDRLVTLDDVFFDDKEVTKKKFN
jgi:hypothetical protein